MRARPFAAVRVLVIVAALAFTGNTAGAGVSTVLSAEETVSPVIHHDLSVRIFPSLRRISVRDRITLSGNYPSEFDFNLHQGLTVTASEGATISRIGEDGVIAASYRAVLHDGVRTFMLSYEGDIDHPIEPVGGEQARGFSATRGIISGEGVYLAGESFWYPVLAKGLLTFRMELHLPPGWDAVSQGGSGSQGAATDTAHVIWNAAEPQEEIYLIAARFTAYRKSVGSHEALAYLRSPDEALAAKYLDATGRYLTLYERLIGPYPYPKFAMVENFWETGFGMPSFTLLGPKVIRLPFILTSSYPHEILHNWWGNSVFPDYEKGNWSEGLTAYLADHLIKEQQSGGAEYRQTTLQKYADYVDAGRDFPLTSFTSRHSSPSEAIGYGKSLMLFHMLRRNLGDSLFVQGLRRFYAAYRFRSASFDDLMQSFRAVSGQDLGPFFSQWVERTGAPEIRIVSAAREQVDEGEGLDLVIEQVQEGPAYRLDIPVAVSMIGRAEAHQEVLSMTGKLQKFRMSLPGRPNRVDVDPEYDLFRRLDRSEIPPAISSVLGSRRLLVVLPSEAPDAMIAAYQSLGRTVGLSGPDDVQIRLDSSIDRLPDDRAVVILGWENRYLRETSGVFAVQGAQISETAFSINETAMSKKGHSIVLTARRNDGSAIAFVAADDSASLPGLARKLPHYHKYSYLVFEGAEPTNILKGQWEVRRSPLTTFIPEPRKGGRDVPMAILAPRPALADLPEQFSGQRMIETIRFLAHPDQQGRGFGTAGLDRSAGHIAHEFRAAGLMPAGDGESFFQSWEEMGGPENRKAVLRNVIAALPGTDPSLGRQCVIVGAHYDHLGPGWPDVREGNAGLIHPGADDNASGVAVLLELARFFGQQPKPKRTIVFAAFTAEEAGRLGSRHYLAAETAYQPKDCVAMINLDTVGRLGRNRIIVLNASSAAEWPHIFRGAGYVTGAEIAISDQQLDSSDQMTFQENGIPAVQIFTGAHADYHRPTDTPEKIDAAGLVKVTAVVKEAVEYLAARNEPLTSAGNLRTGEQRKGRTASLGIIPDYAGSGCIVSGVIPGSPAETCGIRAGDVIVAVNDRPITGLRDLADVLKTVEPGTKLTIRILRDGSEQTVETEAAPR